MAFCRNCGSPVDGQFCARCGTPVAAPAPGSSTPPAGQAYPPSAGPAVPPAAAATGLTDNVASLLCYILGLITGILFLVLAPYNQNKTIRFHAFQSIFFNIATIVLMIIMSILGTIFFSISFLMLSLWGMVHLLVWLGILVVWVLLMVKAYQGQKWLLPVIGPLAEKQA